MERYAIDLTAVIEKLRGEKQFQNLMKAMQRFESARSIATDLEGVQQALDALRAIHDIGDGRMMFGAALMTHMVILYCRATVSDKGPRFNIGATKNYNADLRERHERIVELRNKAIAHFGRPTQEHSLRWTDERIVTLVYADGQERLSSVYKRANFLGAALEDIEALLASAIPTVATISEDRADDIAKELSAVENQRLLSDIVASCPFFPEEFYSSPEAAEQLWQGNIQHHEIFTPPNSR